MVNKIDKMIMNVLKELQIINYTYFAYATTKDINRIRELIINNPNISNKEICRIYINVV